MTEQIKILSQTIKIIITLVILSITANAEVKFQVFKNGIINITNDKTKMEVTTKIENIRLYHKDFGFTAEYVLLIDGFCNFNLTEKEYIEIKREILYGTF